MKLANLITFDMGFIKTPYDGLDMCGEEFGFAWNTWETGGAANNALRPWVGQTTLGRIYKRYRIINAITKMLWVPMGLSNLTSDAAGTTRKYRGDVYFYCVQSNQNVSPLSGLAPSLTGQRIGGLADMDLRTLLQIPTIKVKRRRWGETPQKCNITYMCNLPTSTRLDKDPAFANDTGDYAGTITPGPTPTFFDPNKVCYFYFGWFVPYRIQGKPPTAGWDLPQFKCEMKDVTLSAFSDVDTNAGLL